MALADPPMIILLAEDDPGHARLVQRNLRRAGVGNEVLHFGDGQALLDFLQGAAEGPTCAADVPYLLLLDIRMPKVDGVEVLRRLKADDKLRRMPVIMLTTTDDPREVALCHDLGCSHYITKPVQYERFVHVVEQLGGFLLLVRVPPLQGEGRGQGG